MTVSPAIEAVAHSDQEPHALAKGMSVLCFALSLVLIAWYFLTYWVYPNPATLAAFTPAESFFITGLVMVLLGFAIYAALVAKESPKAHAMRYLIAGSALTFIVGAVAIVSVMAHIG